MAEWAAQGVHLMARAVSTSRPVVRDKGLRKHPFDGRCHAAVSHLQVPAQYAEERVPASGSYHRIDQRSKGAGW